MEKVFLERRRDVLKSVGRLFFSSTLLRLQKDDVLTLMVFWNDESVNAVIA